MPSNLDFNRPYKPLDFGQGGVTCSIDGLGRMVALSCYHPQHGYVTLTTAAPFPESERYNPAAVRAYRAALAKCNGFGYYPDVELAELAGYLAEYTALRHESGAAGFAAVFPNDVRMDALTYASDQGVQQVWRVWGAVPIWRGTLCLMRCAYTQLTEGGPIPAPPVELRLHFGGGILTIENAALPWAVAIGGFPEHEAWERYETGPAQVCIVGVEGETLLSFAFGPTADSAVDNVRRLGKLWRGSEHGVGGFRLDRKSGESGRHTGPDLPTEDLLLERGIAYSRMMTVPVGEGVCLLTDHMLLPLSWNRDAYYMARALLSWHSRHSGQQSHAVDADTVRRHLIWMFEQAERIEGLWARCYMANGRIKDSAFQLDQQLFPLLELADYVLETGDRATLDRLQGHVGPVLGALMSRKAPEQMLFPTDETPADDPIALLYHLSSHILFWRVLMRLRQVGLPGEWAHMAAELRAAIDRAFIAAHDGQKLYAYATDGAGRHHFYHDANDFPLALAPTWGFCATDDPVWRATIAFAFSEANVGGCYAGRLGSVHTRAPWPLGDVQDLIIARTTGDQSRAARARERLIAGSQWDGALPEACDPQTGQVISRHWFAWPNAAYACVELGAFD